MKIVHITDLHFGSHNEQLASTLPSRIATIKPDLVLATGDLVDTPDKQLFKVALDFLKSLEGSCAPLPDPSDVDRPRVIAIPGNHDVFSKGVLPTFHKTYGDILGHLKSHYYFRHEKVWVYGFNSAQRLLATGEVPDEELARFHNEYDRLLREAADFQRAFKIVIVHHHPLPVNWQTDSKQQLLTFVNAGAFISAMLTRKIDLVLHGHEHLQAISHLRSTLGGKGDAELTVVSLGATLKRVINPALNWFNVISIETEKDVTLETFPSKGVVFESSGQYSELRSSDQTRTTAFERWKEQAGYQYDEVASVADLRVDGDCHRVVEYDGLEILKADSPRAKAHEIQIPPTSGYIECLRAEPDQESHYQELHLDEEGSQLQRPRATSATIRYGSNLSLNVGDKISYKCSWWSVNSFAMDEWQFRRKYPEDHGLIEFTHFPVVDPIKDLTVVVRFPKGFAPRSRPQIRVTNADNAKMDNREWAYRNDLKKELEQLRALRYLESVGIAALRVSTPEQGCCYGIEWRVPKGKGVTVDKIVAQVQARVVKAVSSGRRSEFLETLLNVGKMAREQLLKNWEGPLWISLMMWDESINKLVVISAAKLGLGDSKEWDLSELQLAYGEGIAGRAFKTNECRFYEHLFDQQEKDPTYYRPVAGQEPEALLLSIPLQSSKHSEHVYGVLNLSSPESDCPLDLAGEPGRVQENAPYEEFRLFWKALSIGIQKDLAAIVRPKS